MRLPRASSLLQHTLLAACAALAPPFVMLASVTVAVQDLAATGARTVVDAAATVDLSRSVAEHVVAMERLSRQRRTLGDDELRTLYVARRAEFVSTVRDLEALPLEPDVRGGLARLRTGEASVHAVLTSSATDSIAYDLALGRFDELTGDARDVLGGAVAGIGRAATELRARAVALERRLAVAGAITVPLVLGVLGVSVARIVRPLRRLDDAIRGLGAGALDRPIRIRGPEDLRAVGDRLEWLRERLIAAESDRVRLLRHVSHELKTPLTCIREGAQLLDDGVAGPLTPDQHELATIIASNADQLGRRIEDLLRASELRDHGAVLEVRPVALDRVIREVLDQNAVAARARGLVVRLVAPDAPVEVPGDAQKLRTAVDNLVTNAIKFSPDGGKLTVELLADGDGVQIVVEDEGPGVDAAEREAVFEAFYQGRARLLRNVPGTGLGLSIAREYVRAHGGDVTIHDGRVGARVVLSLGGR